MPTETVYGLAARFDDPEAILRVFAAKQRPLFDPLIVHVPEVRDSEALAALGVVQLPGALRPTVDALISQFWPGPLTLVLPRDPRVPDLATSGLDTVAVRCPAHPIAQALIRGAGPLVAPSANRFGRISPTSAHDVVAELDASVGYVVDGGPCAHGVESTIVAPQRDGTLLLLRPGATPLDALGQLVAPAAPGAAIAPGMLPSHYAPRTSLYTLSGPADDPASWSHVPEGRTGVLLLRPTSPALASGVRAARCNADVILSPCTTAAADLALAVPSPPGADVARGLFAALRSLDHAALDVLATEPVRDSEGLWPAIQDRLARAAWRPPVG